MGNVSDRLLIARQTLADRRHDADDRQEPRLRGWRRVVPEPDLLADRVLVGEVRSGEGFVDQNGVGAGGRVDALQPCAATEPQAERLEVSRPDCNNPRRPRALASSTGSCPIQTVREGDPTNGVALASAAASTPGSDSSRSSSCRNNNCRFSSDWYWSSGSARRSSHTRERSMAESARCRACALCVNSAAEFKRMTSDRQLPYQQPGHEARGARRRTSSGLVQYRGQVGARQVNGRQQPEHNTDANTEERQPGKEAGVKGEYRPVPRQVEIAGFVREPRHAERSQTEADEAGQCARQRAFDEQLASDPSPARAEGEPEGHFPARASERTNAGSPRANRQSS